MALHPHLPLRRLEGELERRKRPGFGNPPERNAGQHGTRIREAAETVVANHARRAQPAEVDPSLILKIRLAGYVDEAAWHRMDLSVLSSGPDQTLVLFSSDVELQKFRTRAETYSGPIPIGQTNHSYSSVFGMIEDVTDLAPEDRIGQVLREEGILTPNDFLDAETYIIDVELWQPSPELLDVFLNRLERALDEHEGIILSEYRGQSISIARVRSTGMAIRSVLALPEVASIDLPPVPDIPPVVAPNITIEEIPAPAPPPEGAITIGILDSGLSSSHPLVEQCVVGSFGEPAAIGDDDVLGHGTPVAGIMIYGDLRQRLEAGRLDGRFRIASAKVVDNNGAFDVTQTVPALMESAIRRLHNEFGCRVINISLGDRNRPVGDRPSPWAAVLDALARELDLVVVVSAGNTTMPLAARFGDDIVEEYPEYLMEDGNRVLEPSSAINALVVGSIAHSNGLTLDDHVDTRPITEAGAPSPFTRVGPWLNGWHTSRFL